MHRPCQRVCNTAFILVVVVTALALGNPALAAYVGGVTFSHDGPRDLAYGTQITMSIDYKVDDPAGGRVLARPMSNGNLAPGYLASPTPLLGQGTGTVAQWFTITSGHVLVDAVRFQLLNADFSAVVLEFTVPVQYQYGPHGIDNLTPDHARHSRLRHGTRLNMTFSYSVAAAGCRIFARPYRDGQLVPGYSASGSADLPPSGTSTQWFSFAGDADITHIRFQIVDLGGATLAEHFVRWDCHWRALGLMDITFSEPNITMMHNSQNLFATFTLDHQHADALRVRTYCVRDGEICPGTTSQIGASVPAGPQSVTRYTRVSSGTEEVDAIRFVVGTLTEVFLSFDVPLRLKYGPHAVQDIAFVPASPAILSPGQRLYTTFNYVTDHPENVLIFARAAFQGNTVPGYAAGGSPYYPPPSGSSGSEHYVVYNSNRTANSMSLRMTNIDQDLVLMTWFEPCWFVWGTTGAVTGVDDHAVPAPVASIGPCYPNPFNPTATIPVQLNRDSRVELAVYDARGRLVRTLHDGVLVAGSHRFTLNADGLGSGAYICRLQTPTGVSTQRLTLVK